MAEPQIMNITVTNVHHTMFMKRKPRQVWRRAIVVMTGLGVTASLLFWLLYNNNTPAK